MNENILDDNLTDIDKPFVRTVRIQQVENVVIVGGIISLGIHFLDFFSYNIIYFIFSSTTIAYLGIFAAVIWWRNISIEFDLNTSTQQIVLPGLLNFLRILIPLYNAWVLLSFLIAVRFLYNYLFMENSFLAGLDLRFYIFRFFFSIIMAFLYIYYWRITKQSMDFINK